MLVREDSGLRRLLASLGCDLDALLRDVSAFVRENTRSDGLCQRIVNDAFRVASTERIDLVTRSGGVVDRKQVVHSCHLLAGFLNARSDAAMLLQRHGIEEGVLDRIAWDDHRDPDAC